MSTVANSIGPSIVSALSKALPSKPAESEAKSESPQKAEAPAAGAKPPETSAAKSTSPPSPAKPEPKAESPQTATTGTQSTSETKPGDTPAPRETLNAKGQPSATEQKTASLDEAITQPAVSTENGSSPLNWNAAAASSVWSLVDSPAVAAEEPPTESPNVEESAEGTQASEASSDVLTVGEGRNLELDRLSAAEIEELGGTYAQVADSGQQVYAVTRLNEKGERVASTIITTQAALNADSIQIDRNELTSDGLALNFSVKGEEGNPFKTVRLERNLSEEDKSTEIMVLNGPYQEFIKNQYNADGTTRQSINIKVDSQTSSEEVKSAVTDTAYDFVDRMSENKFAVQALADRIDQTTDPNGIESNLLQQIDRLPEIAERVVDDYPQFLDQFKTEVPGFTPADGIEQTENNRWGFVRNGMADLAKVGIPILAGGLLTVGAIATAPVWVPAAIVAGSIGSVGLISYLQKRGNNPGEKLNAGDWMGVAFDSALAGLVGGGSLIKQMAKPLVTRLTSGAALSKWGGRALSFIDDGFTLKGPPITGATGISRRLQQGRSIIQHNIAPIFLASEGLGALSGGLSATASAAHGLVTGQPSDPGKAFQSGRAAVRDSIGNFSGLKLMLSGLKSLPSKLSAIRLPSRAPASSPAPTTTP